MSNFDLAKIKVTHILGDSVTTLYDLTDEYFSIHPKSKLLRVLFPNGGESLNPEERPDTVFQWTSAGITDVKIELSMDNGISWSVLEQKYKSNGAYRWRLWPLDSTSTNARLRITDVSSDAGANPATDMSDSYFSINVWEPALKIINPGPKLFEGKDAVIKWYSPRDVHNVKLEYSVDGGKTWKLIADNIPANSRKLNQYSWKSVPADKTGDAMLRVSESSGRKSVSGKFKMNR